MTNVFGIPGLTLVDLLEGLKRSQRNVTGDVIVQIGICDCAPLDFKKYRALLECYWFRNGFAAQRKGRFGWQTPLPDFCTALRSLKRSLKRQQLYFIPIFYTHPKFLPGKWREWNRQVDLYNAAIETSGVALLKVSQPLERELIQDGHHLTTAGHRRLAGEIWSGYCRTKQG